MAISGYRAGYQPIRTPQVSIKTYGVAGKWSSEAVRARSTSGSANANDLFFGPQQTGPDYGAMFATISGDGQTEALKDYVKRNVDKFSGGTLQGMLEATGLVDWYTQRQQEELAKAAKSIQDNIDALDLSSLRSDRTKQILAGIEPAKPATAPPTAGTTTTDGTTATGGTSTATTGDATSGGTGTAAASQGVDILV
ncbi:hypothetical protein [Oharaeibacter diazotrophicus]|uniref:Uncharacterized protein n=1 Tax=Oharaeibacter diazotrophicus TaxID=1920512 RepID=A0A4R6RLY8_9HYPH|nr:hypothetical protein [Oharaeibacter diazotrophicus]TDP87532.1 hypothetical protein EDD54_1429 [Oharaeibacter diazotrophicus]BBE70524.1 hypothetical protein OHA_1_00088 [Pleomorphomonas sp. SM30]GLS77270.1 hypothetical protein GCM10007904_26070 [Oharaeibacter diazotrophicus]